MLFQGLHFSFMTGYSDLHMGQSAQFFSWAHMKNLD